MERLRFENPWWLSGAIEEDFRSMRRRLYFELLFPLVEEKDIRRAVVLMGPRRVGKTVLLYHSIEELLRKGIHRQRIAYIGIDSPIFVNRGLEQLFLLARKAVGDDSSKDWYVFFDEIQYLKDWEIHLKVLVDSYPQAKFIVSGSAAAALKLKSQESGAGRFTEFMLPPLTFHEYIHLKGYGDLIRQREISWKGNLETFYTSINIRELNKHFIDYINFGGYPEVIFSEKIQSNPSRYIKGDIVDKVLLRDLPSLYGIQDVQELNAFFSTLAYYSGQEFSLESLSGNAGVDKNLLKKYLTYLEASFLIKIIHRIDDTAKKFQRATVFKIYLSNPSLRSALFSPITSTDDAFGAMVETAIFSQWMHRDWISPWYAGWKHGEVDLVGLDAQRLKPVWAVEVKWSNRFVEKPAELKSLIHFCKKNSLDSAIVTSIDKEIDVEVDGISLHFFPAAIYAYTVGINTILQKQRKGF